jgi:hypothetical protein
MNSKTISGLVALVIVAGGGWWIYRKYGNPFATKPARTGLTQQQALDYVAGLPTFDVSRAFGPLDLRAMPWVSSYVDSDGRVRG